MSVQAGEGKSRFDHAMDAAQRLLDSFPATDAVSIITMASPAAAVVGQPVVDRRYLRDRLMGIRPTQRATDLTGAWTLAAELPGEPELPPGNRILYVLSDFPRADWESKAAGQASPVVDALKRLAGRLTAPGESLHLIPVVPGEPANVGVVRLAPESTLLGLHWPVRLAAEVHNFGPSSVRNLQLQLRREGRIIRREPLPRLDPGSSATVILSTQFAEAGTHLIEARVVGMEADALPGDDARLLSLDIRQTTPVLLVDGRPGTTQLSGQAGFLAAALAPRIPRGEPAVFEPRTVTEADLANENWGDIALVALCNVPRLPAEMWRRLEQFVERGGGLLVFGGDLVNVDHYNRFGWSDGRGLLPGRLRSAMAPGEGSAELHFQTNPSPHPLMTDFAAEPESGLFTARVDGYIPVEVPPGRADVVLRYSNDDPALVAGPYGAGRVLKCGITPRVI